jgi:hypothetical protein
MGPLSTPSSMTMTLAPVWDAPAASASRTPYGTPSAPSSAKISKSGYAPATLTLSWGASSTTGGGSVSYQYKLNSGSWKSVGTSRSVTLKNKAAGTYSFQARAYNSGSKKYSSAKASNKVTVSKPPPTASVKKGIKSPYGAPGWIVCVSYSNLPSATYTLTPQYNGGAFGSKHSWSASLSGAGHWCGTNSINNPGSGGTVSVKMTSSAWSSTPSVSGPTWYKMASSGYGVGTNK